MASRSGQNQTGRNDQTPNPLDTLTPRQLANVRKAVLKGIADIEQGRYTEYVGREGLAQLAADIQRRGRERLRRTRKAKQTKPDASLRG